VSTQTDNPPFTLPRGPHALSRAEVAASQRSRLTRAFTELLAEGGYTAVTIGELAKRAGVSRGAFYEQFASKEECLLAAYEAFATGLLTAMTEGVSEDSTWDEFISLTLDGYLGTLERDPVAARAFIVEMDAGGELARERRRQAIQGFAALLAHRHRSIQAIDPSVGDLPESVYRGLALGVRELVHERLSQEQNPRLAELRPQVILWITAMVEGAAAAHARLASK
jgi:AcrR family transcriptional regulator